MNKIFESLYTKTTDPPKQSIDVEIANGELDQSTVGREAILKIIPKCFSEIESIPVWRRIRLNKCPLLAPYLALGCILLDHLIQDERSRFEKQVYSTLKYLSNMPAIKASFRTDFENAAKEFEKLLEEIKTERIYQRTREPDQRSIVEAVSIKIYRKLAKGDYLKVILLAAQGILLRYLLDNPSIEFNKGFSQYLRNSLYILENKYFTHACGIFADVCLFKITFFDFPGSVKPTKFEYYPDPKKHEFRFQAFILNGTEGNGNNMIAFGYPMMDSVAGYQLQSNFLSEKNRRNGRKDIKVKIEPKVEAQNEDFSSVSSGFLMDGKKLKGEIKVEEKMVQKKEERKEKEYLIQCDQCRTSLTKSYIYHNSYCKHDICIDCLNSLGTRSKSHCAIRICTAKMDAGKVREFLRIPKNRQIEPGEEKDILIQCDQCYSRRLNNPFVFHNHHCSHSICVDCLNDLGSMKSKPFCPVRKCSSKMDPDIVLSFMENFKEGQRIKPQESRQELSQINLFDLKKKQ